MAENYDGRDMRVEGNDVSGYIGVSPEYQNYASETEAPLQPSKKADKDEIAERVREHEKLLVGEPNPAVEQAAAEDRAEDAAAAEAEAKAAADAAAKEKAAADAAAAKAAAKS